jgi:uncharacterized protein YllA (UPF0747 family)
MPSSSTFNSIYIERNKIHKNVEKETIRINCNKSNGIEQISNFVQEQYQYLHDKIFGHIKT